MARDMSPRSEKPVFVSATDSLSDIWAFSNWDPTKRFAADSYAPPTTVSSVAPKGVFDRSSARVVVAALAASASAP